MGEAPVPHDGATVAVLSACSTRVVVRVGSAGVYSGVVVRLIALPFHCEPTLLQACFDRRRAPNVLLQAFHVEWSQNMP